MLRDKGCSPPLLIIQQVVVQAELECHRERVARDLEPKAVDALRVADAELAAREDQLRKRRSVIDGERLAQEHILQNFNAAGP